MDVDPICKHQEVSLNQSQLPFTNHDSFKTWCKGRFGSVTSFRTLEYCQLEHPSLHENGARIFARRAHPAWNTWFDLGMTVSGDSLLSSESYLINIHSDNQTLYVFDIGLYSKLVEEQYCYRSCCINNPSNIRLSEKFREWLKKTSLTT